MTDRENIHQWFLDACTRHPDIAHTEARPKFFEMEFDEIVQSGARMAMQGFNVILEDYREKLNDNGGDYHSETALLAFWVVTQVGAGKATARRAAYAACKTKAYDLLAKMVRDSCIMGEEADLPAGLVRPHAIDLNAVETMTVGPVFDQAFGIRMSVNWLDHQEVDLSRERVEWTPLDE